MLSTLSDSSMTYPVRNVSADFVPENKYSPAANASASADPHGGPDARFFRPDLVRVPMKHAEVEREHREHEAR